MNEFEEKVVYEAIKDELKNFRNNSLYRCPHCEKIIEWNDANYNPEESVYTCQKCNDAFEEYELEELSMFDFLEEMFLAFQRSKNNEQD